MISQSPWTAIGIPFFLTARQADSANLPASEDAFTSFTRRDPCPTTLNLSSRRTTAHSTPDNRMVKTRRKSNSYMICNENQMLY
jgi:hypothetical protein